MKILIAEDNLEIAGLLKRGLQSKGYGVDHIMDGKSALRRVLFHHKKYDLLILDLMLPKKSGFEICKAMRQKDINIPILIISARSGDEDKASAFAYGVEDYLVKPFSFETLLDKIRLIKWRKVYKSVASRAL